MRRLVWVRIGRCEGCADAEVLRMVRAIVSTGLEEALRSGEFFATIRGFRISALRRTLPMRLATDLNAPIGFTLLPRPEIEETPTGVVNIVVATDHHFLAVRSGEPKLRVQVI